MVPCQRSFLDPNETLWKIVLKSFSKIFYTIKTNLLIQFPFGEYIFSIYIQFFLYLLYLLFFH
jgi:hypothetical protein